MTYSAPVQATSVRPVHPSVAAAQGVSPKLVVDKVLLVIVRLQAYSSLMTAYHERVSLPSYNILPSVISAVSAADTARILRVTLPALTKQQHAAMASVHYDLSKDARIAWSALLDIAAKETFGRPFQFSDYKISSIGRDEFSHARKEQLRLLSQASSQHAGAGRAHAYLAKGRLQLI